MYSMLQLPYPTKAVIEGTMQPARRKRERVRPASAALSSSTYAAGSPLPAPRRRAHRVRPGSRRTGGRGRGGEDSDYMSDTPQLLVTAKEHADEMPRHESPQPRPVRLTDRQARWLRASAGTAMLCRSQAGAGFARAAPSRDAKVQQLQLLGLSRKGFRHKIFLQDEDESDESDPVWAGGGRSPDGLFSGSIHKYLQAQRSMQINQRRARSACREMVCAVPHVPTAAASQRRGVKPKDQQRTTARPSSAISSLGIHSQPLILDDEACPDSSYSGEKDMGTGMDGAADDVDQPDPDNWFPEEDEAVDCEEEEWIEIDDSEFLGLDAEFAELDAARQMSSPSSSSGESDGQNGEGVDEDGLIWVTAATLEESLDRSIAKGLSLKESLAEQTWWKERVADLEADQPSCEVLSRVSISSAKKQEVSPPKVQQRVRPGSARARFGWDSPVYVAGGNQGRSSETSLCSGGATFRQTIFDPSFHTPVRLRTAGDCEADVEMLLQAARPTRMSGHREALSRSHTSQAHAVRRFAGSEHAGAQGDDKGERREKRAIAHTQPGVHAAGRAAWADRAAPKVDDRKAQRSLAAPDDPHSRSWSHIQRPVSSLRPPSHALGTARRLSMPGDEAALAASCANDCQSEREGPEPVTDRRWGSVSVEDTVCTRCSPVGCDGRSSPIAFHQGDGSVRVSANSLVAGGRSHSPTGAQSQGAIGRVPWEPFVKLAGADDELSAASTPPLTSRRLARSAMLISSIAGCGGEDLDAPSAAHCASAAGGVGKGVASGSGVEVWRGGFNAPMVVLERQSDKDAGEAVPFCPATPVLRHRRSAQAQAMSPMAPSAGPTSRPDSVVLGGQSGRWRMEVKAVVGGGAGDKCERAKGERGTKARKGKSAKAGPAGASSGKTPQQACVGSHKSLRQHISLYKVLGSDI